jgi:hypothetical protein
MRRICDEIRILDARDVETELPVAEESKKRAKRPRTTDIAGGNAQADAGPEREGERRPEKVTLGVDRQLR